MFHRCDLCGKLSKVDVSFRVSPIDAVGFVLLLLVAMAPVWLVSFLCAVITSTPEGDASPLQELITIGAAVIYFVVFGSKIAKFISLFVNYKFSIKSWCKPCNRVFAEKEFPAPMERLSV